MQARTKQQVLEMQDYYRQIAGRIMWGLQSNLGLQPHIHYVPKVRDSARVLVLTLEKLNPVQYERLNQIENRLQMLAGFSDKQRLRIWHVGTNAHIEIPKPQRYWNLITIKDLEARRAFRLGHRPVVGLGTDDRNIIIDYKGEQVYHLLIAGETGSGKTNLQTLLLYALIKYTNPVDTQVVIIDPAKFGQHWGKFANTPNLVAPIATTIDEGNLLLQRLRLERDRRASVGQTKPYMFIVIDELAALTRENKQAENDLIHIATLGRECGMRLIAATQYPQIKFLGSAELKRNITTRICGLVDDAAASQNALGIPQAGGEKLMKHGDFIFRNGHELTRFTAAYIRPTTDLSTLERGQPVGSLPELTGEPRTITPQTKPPASNESMVEGWSTDDLAAIQAQMQHPSQAPDPLKVDQVAEALFNPMGTTRSSRYYEIGTTKALRLRRLASAIRHWAARNDVSVLPEVHPFLEPELLEELSEKDRYVLVDLKLEALDDESL